jgi:enoyl-CoA hydratase/carnithine racemase
MLLLGETIDSSEAYRLGLVHRVVSPSQVLAEAHRLAEALASKATIALRYAKEAVNKGLDMTLEQGLRLEGDLYMILHTTDDRQEGIRAFQQKRPAQFKGK